MDEDVMQQHFDNSGIFVDRGIKYIIMMVLSIHLEQRSHFNAYIIFHKLENCYLLRYQIWDYSVKNTADNVNVLSTVRCWDTSEGRNKSWAESSTISLWGSSPASANLAPSDIHLFASQMVMDWNKWKNRKPIWRCLCILCKKQLPCVTRWKFFINS